MAKLDELVESLNVKLSTREPLDKTPVQIGGHRRRAWLTPEEQSIDSDKDNDLKGVYKPHIQKGSINPVDQPHSIGPINPVDQSHLVKEVYKPVSISLEKLRGNPLKIAQYFFELSTGKEGAITEKLTRMQIMRELEISKDSAKTGLKFLLKNSLVERTSFQVGKSGWSKYKLQEKLFNDLQEAYQKGCIDPITQKGFNNSSYYINNITTINKPLLSWKDIDIDPLKEIGFNENHLLQLRSKNTPEVVQESINHFAYGLQFNPKTKKYEEPLTVLIGVLRKGEAWLEANYRAAHEIALEKVIEEKKKQQERAKALEEEIDKLEGEAWLASISDEEKAEITKGLALGAFSKSVQESVKRAHLLKYFKEKVKGKKGIDTGA